MNRYYHGLVLAVMWIAFSTNANSQVVYKCSYVDSINITNLETQQASIRQSLTEKGLEESMIEAYISKFFGDENSFLQVQQRIVEIYKDSAIIELDYQPARTNQVFQLPARKLMVKDGQLFKYSPSLGSFSISNIPDSAKIFIPTLKTRQVLSYKCDEYISQDSTYIIWVNKELPSQINPGISAKNIRGAILAFEARKGTAITKSVIKNLERVKIEI